MRKRVKEHEEGEKVGIDAKQKPKHMRTDETGRICLESLVSFWSLRKRVREKSLRAGERVASCPAAVGLSTGTKSRGTY